MLSPKLEARMLQALEIKNEIAKNTNSSPEEVKKLDKKLQDTMDELKRVENES